MPNGRRSTVGLIAAAALAVLVIASWIYFAVRPDGKQASASGSSGAQQGGRLHLPHHPRIFYVGDSIGADMFSSTAAQGFQDMLTAKLHGREVGAVNNPGFTVDESTPLLRRMRPVVADLVVIELGTNDLGRGAKPAEFANSYRRLLQLAKNRMGSAAKALCVGVWNSTSITSSFDAVLSEVCTAAGGVFCQISDLYGDEALRGPAGTRSYLGDRDDYHPNDAGHTAIARRLKEAVIQ